MFIGKQLPVRTLLTLLLLLLYSILNAQWITQKPSEFMGQIPEITPPSPTVSSLMKFEEVPVNNYTGIPDISIPICSIETLSKDITIGVGLKYHPSSIAVDETASYTGLGWNLFAGGTISRTVNGSPDEIFTGEARQRIGILQDNINDPAQGDDIINRYYEVLSLLGTGNSDILKIGRFIWKTAHLGRFDTQHDLFQYNFMGHTGRFFIKRNQSSGVLEVVKLDNDNSINIKLLSTSTYDYYMHQYNIEFNGFELYDDKGYKYVFGVTDEAIQAIEVTDYTDANAIQGYRNGMDISPSKMIYKSAFHLTKIFDNNNKLLADFNYIAATETTTVENSVHNAVTQSPDAAYLLKASSGGTIEGSLPMSTRSVVTTKVVTLKLSQIDIVNKGKIKFEVLTGREDSDINPEAAYLHSIIVENQFNEKIKEFHFHYFYSTIIGSGFKSAKVIRMMLESVVQKDVFGVEPDMTYSLSYKEPYINQEGALFKDYWGYYNRRKYGNREPDKYWCTAQVLQKMSLPTGGAVEFDFGPNTYSFIGDEPVIDFSIDDDYIEPIEVQVPEEGEIGFFPDPVIPIRELFFIPIAHVPGGSFYFYSDTDPTHQSIDALGDKAMNDGTGRTQPFTIESNHKYYIGYTVPEGSEPGFGRVQIVSKDRAITTNSSPLPDNQWLMGGGVRINKIKYFTNDDPLNLPAKVKTYDYRLVSNPAKSSGSLAFAKPLFDFYQFRELLSNNQVINGSTTNNYFLVAKFWTTATHNNLKYIRTQGSDVGYKNVTVREFGNGKSQFTYTSPIDYPQPEANYHQPPFPHTQNLDYKRGLLLNERHFAERIIQNDTLYRILSDIKNDYKREMYNNDYDGYRVIGHTFLPSTSAIDSRFDPFGGFDSCMEATKWDGGYYTPALRRNDYQAYLSPGEELRELFGWPVLTKRVSNEYFYTNDNFGNNVVRTPMVSTTEEFTYDFSIKKMIQSTKTNSSGEVLKTKFFYDQNFANRNRIGMLKSTEKYRDDILLEKDEITFLNSWGNNSSYLPSAISYAKGSNPLEIKVHFNKYDEFSNPLEVRRDNDVTICYIWGYNKSLPIAMIKNMDYATIAANPTLQSYINSAVSASNSNSTASLLENLKLIRSTLAGTALVTGFTYKPLVGVTNTMDERGYVTSYSYDGYGRLKESKDADSNTISTNKYHYRSSN